MVIIITPSELKAIKKLIAATAKVEKCDRVIAVVFESVPERAYARVACSYVNKQGEMHYHFSAYRNGQPHFFGKAMEGHEKDASIAVNISLFKELKKCDWLNIRVMQGSIQISEGE